MAKRTSLAQLSSARQQLRDMQLGAAGSSRDERVLAELQALQERLVALEIAHEELEQQNEELQTTREALENQRYRYLSLFDEAPFGYLVTDLQGVVEEANRLASAMLGVAQQHLAGKPLFLYLLPEHRSVFRTLVAQARAGELAGEVEVVIKPRQGEPFAAVLTSVRDLSDRSRPPLLRWAIRDVSHTKRMEEALRSSEERLRHSQRMEAIGRLAGGIAHSFNNLLAAVAFQCELLHERLEEGDEKRAYVTEIQKAQERAAELARQLLAFGRRQVLQPQVLQLNELIQEMEPMLRRLIGEDISLETRLDPAAGALHVDLGQLEQVLLNLIVNARDAMPAGGTLLLASRPVEVAGAAAAAEPGESELPPGPYVELSVVDTGTGISPEVRERLFEPFFTTKERGKGTGLGLATVHGIVHQSGGRIRVESEPGQGSRFIILLPRAAAVQESPPKLPARTERRSRKGSEVVLLVEDEDNIREPAVEILEGRGYRVLAARDAAQALQVAESHRGPIHILVTDVVMPGMSGNQLAQRLVHQRPEVRVLYISGYPEDSIAHHGVLQPEQHFLQKPFPPGRFLEKVREVLDSSLGKVAAGGGGRYETCKPKHLRRNR